MATSFHRLLNNAYSQVASAYTAGSGSLVVADGSRFGTDFPILISTYRGKLPLSILDVTGRSGNVLTIAGAADGTTDVDLIVGDLVANATASRYLEELQDAVNDLEDAVESLEVGGDPADFFSLAPQTIDRNDIIVALDARAARAYPDPSHFSPLQEWYQRNGSVGVQITAEGSVIGYGRVFAGAFSAAGEAVFSSATFAGASSFSAAYPQGAFECRAATGAGGGAHVRLWSNDGAPIEATHRMASLGLGAYDGTTVVNGARLSAFAGTTWSPSDRSTEVHLVSAWGGTSLDTRMKTTDRPILQAPASAPTDLHLFNGSLTFQLDEPAHNLVIRVRYSDGTLKTATIPLV